MITGSRKLGGTVSQIIDDTPRTLETDILSGSAGYPMILRLMAEGEGAYVYQGGASISLPGTPKDPIGIGEWVEVTVDGKGDSYFAIKRSGSGSGTLVARRIDALVV